MTVPILYIVFFLLPCAFFIGFIMFLSGRGIHNRESRLFLLASLSFMIAHLAEFARHLLPVSYSPFFTMFLVSPLLLLGACALVHTGINYVEKSLKISFHYWQYVAYVPVLFPLLSWLIPPLQLKTHNFYWEGIWLYRDHLAYTIGIYSCGIITCLAICGVMLVGYIKSTNPFYKQHFAYFLKSGAVLTLALMLLFVLFQDFSLPPVPTLLLGFLCCVLIIVGLVRYDVSASIASRYRQLLTLSPTAILILDEHYRIIEANDVAFEHVTNKRATTLQELFLMQDNFQTSAILLNRLEEQGQLRSVVHQFFIVPTNESVYYEFDASKIQVGGEFYYFVLWRDVTKEHLQAAKIRELAYTDQLTGLHNRTYFVPAVEERLQSGERAVLILSDLNFFKQINDKFGHLVGDAVLQHTAYLFQTVQTDDVLLSRLGGDEFLLYIPLRNKSPQQIVDYLRELFQTTPYIKDDISITVYPSFGAVTIPHDGTNFEHLYHLADIRMYADKKQIKQTIQPMFQ